MLTKSSVVKSSSGESQKKAMAQSSTQQIIQMELAQNWGCPGAIGLTGVQFLGPGSNLISGEHCTVRCSPDRPEDELLLK
jgi:hypothetical protein